MHPLIASYEQTCEAVPEQYEGQLHDGRWFYFRLRFGRASLAVGRDYEDVMGRMDTVIRVSDERYFGMFDSEQQRAETLVELFKDVQCHCPDCIRCGCGLWERHHTSILTT